jgi:predicted Zn-dependent peptidase
MTDPRNYGTDSSKSIGVRLRLAQTFKLAGQSTSDILGEIKALTPDDVEDLKREFNAAGYPTT